MRIIKIESKAYLVRESQYRMLVEKKEELENKQTENNKNGDILDFINEIKSSFKKLGNVDLDISL